MEKEIYKHCNCPECVDARNETTSNKSALSDGLCALKAKAKLYIDANVWDGEDRSKAIFDMAQFNPHDLQELIDDLLEYLAV